MVRGIGMSVFGFLDTSGPYMPSFTIRTPTFTYSGNGPIDVDMLGGKDFAFGGEKGAQLLSNMS